MRKINDVHHFLYSSRSLRKPSEVFWRPQGSPLEVPLETSLMVLIGLYVGIIFAIDYFKTQWSNYHAEVKSKSQQLMSLVAHLFGRFEFRIFVIVSFRQAQLKKKSKLIFEIWHIQIDDLATKDINMASGKNKIKKR